MILPRQSIGGIMRLITLFLLLFVGLGANARMLHVGDNTIKLSQTKTTSPALHIKVDDELWYGKMGGCQLPMNEDTDKELKIKYNDTEYWVSDVEDYVIVEGKLIAANCNIYLESTGTQWIDTYTIPKDYTTSELIFKCDNLTPGVGFAGIFGTMSRIDFNTGNAGYARYYIRFIQQYKAYWYAVGQTILQPEQHNHKTRVILDAANKQVVVDDIKYTANINMMDKNTTNSYLFAANGSVGNMPVKIYSNKIYEYNKLVRHFVPVPCGLKIGDFVVPSNGMWDIVEQKFYGNMGTGDFIYGIDG